MKHTEHDTSKFILHSKATLDEVVAQLRAASADRSRTALEKLETALGWNYSPEGIMYNDFLRARMDPADHSIADFMHVLYVNGVVNLNLGLLFRGMQGTSCTYESCYAFAKLWSFPKILGGPKHCGVECMQPDRAESSWEAKSFKGSASELRSILPVLCFFFRAVLQQGILHEKQKDQCECVMLLSAVITEIEASERQEANPDRMQSYLEQWLVLFKRSGSGSWGGQGKDGWGGSLDMVPYASVLRSFGRVP